MSEILQLLDEIARPGQEEKLKQIKAKLFEIEEKLIGYKVMEAMNR